MRRAATRTLYAKRKAAACPSRTRPTHADGRRVLCGMPRRLRKQGWVTCAAGVWWVKGHGLGPRPQLAHTDSKNGGGWGCSFSLLWGGACSVGLGFLSCGFVGCFGWVAFLVGRPKAKKKNTPAPLPTPPRAGHYYRGWRGLGMPKEVGHRRRRLPAAPRAMPRTQTATCVYGLRVCAACRDAHLACQKEGGGDQGRQAVAVNGLGGVL